MISETRMEFVRILISMMVVHFICSESLNTWHGDSISWWQSTSDFIPTHSTAFGTLQLRDGLYMEFDITFHGTY